MWTAESAMLNNGGRRTTEIDPLDVFEQKIGYGSRDEIE
jgi:hypothetical protein